MQYIIYFILLCLSSSLHSKIIETAHFNEIVKYIDKETLVVLDIDDTLLIPIQTLGTDAWFTHRLNQLKKTENSSLALDKALAEWEAVRHLTEVKIVEKGTDVLIESLQDQKITIIGLTTQGLALATRTAVQLQSLHIDLAKTAPSQSDHYFINEHGVLYRKGILFTSGTPKGLSLLMLLDKIGYTPKHILFINDKKTHLEDVEKSLSQTKIRFTGLRYSYRDESVSHFRPEIAEMQWKYSTFSHILSDQEAEAMLKITNTVSATQ